MRSPVIVIGRFAFKFARDKRGRACNLYEAKLYRCVNATRRALLCPVPWVSRNNGSAPSSNNKYLFDGLPWPLRLPLQIVCGAVCGVLIYAALAFMYVIAASP
jgi:hypothetical protein